MSTIEQMDEGAGLGSTQPSRAAASVLGAAPMRVIRMPEVKQRVGLSRSKIYTLIASNDFPQKIQLGLRAVGFLSNEIDRWIESRVMTGAPRPA